MGVACEKGGGVLANKTKERAQPGVDGSTWAVVSLVPFTKMPAAWPGNPAPFPAARVKEVVMPVFPVGMVFVYLRCGVFLSQDGEIWFAGFLSQLSLRVCPTLPVSIVTVPSCLSFHSFPVTERIPGFCWAGVCIGRAQCSAR